MATGKKPSITTTPRPIVNQTVPRTISTTPSVVAAQQGNQAIEYFNVAAHMDPNFWQARFLFGGELASEGRLDEAQQQFSAFGRIRPDFGSGHLYDGLALAESGKLDEALKEFQIALRLEPANLVARQNLEAIRALKSQSH